MNCISTKPPLPISIFSIGLLDALIDDALETLPAALRHQDGVPVAALLLRDRHVPPLLVTLHLEVEILVLDLHMLLPGPGVVLIIFRVHDTGVAVVVLSNQVLEVVVDLPHAIGGDEHLEPPVPPPGHLGELKEPASGILLQVHVILFVIVVFEHHCRLELPLSQVVGVHSAEVFVEIRELDQVLAELRRGGEGHQDLVPPPLGGNLRDLDEAPSLVLLHIEVEGLVLELQRPGGEVLRPPASSVVALRVVHLQLLVTWSSSSPLLAVKVSTKSQHGL